MQLHTGESKKCIKSTVEYKFVQYAINIHMM